MTRLRPQPKRRSDIAAEGRRAREGCGLWALGCRKKGVKHAGVRIGEARGGYGHL